MAAISTAWNGERSAGFADAVRELVDLGFLSVALDAHAVHGDADLAGRVARRAKGEVVALFSYPPAGRANGRSVGNVAGLASPRPEIVRRALGVARAAAGAASNAGTPFVVLCGLALPTIDAAREERWLEDMLTQGRNGSLSAEVRATLDAERADRERHLEVLCRSLHTLSTDLPDAHWLLCTPDTIAGLAPPDELRNVIDDLPGRKIGYWHDAGHAARLEALGVAQQESWLSMLGDHTIGITLSDWSPLGDRLPPNSGFVRWKRLRFQTSRKMQRVIALDPSFPAPLLEDTVREIRELGF